MRITPAYLEQNKALHAGGNYGLGGFRWAEDICEFMAANPVASVLDYGCGQGTFKKAFRGANYIAEYDPAIPGKDGEPEPADLVVCLDVLEHIEPECLDAVLAHIRALTLKAAVFAIHLSRAAKSLPDGRNAHLIIESQEWWLARIGERFTVKASDIAADRIGMRIVAVPRVTQ